MNAARRLRTLACCAILQVGAIVGVPMRPEQVQDLMHSLNEPKIARTDPDESNAGGGSKPDACGPTADEAAVRDGA